LRVLGRIQVGEIALNRCVSPSIQIRLRLPDLQQPVPFNAILFLEDKMVTEINPALCQGCGTCVAACPAGAISGTAFSNDQIFAQIEGLLMINFGQDKVAALG
jgi:ferredoxin